VRKVLLVLGVLGASFAGGAVMNGPGLDLARMVLKTDTIDDATPALPMAGAGAGFDPGFGADLVDRPSSPDPFPTARLPEPTGARSDGTPAQVVPVSDPAPSLRPLRSAATPPDPGPTVPAPPAPEATRPDAPPTPPDLPRPEGADALPELEPTPDLAAATAKADPAVLPASAGPDTDPPSDWTDLRRRLTEAGVSRYWIESSAPSGPARFRAVVPLAGETAVGQVFEAEAADEPAAAELVLRRIALWHVARESQAP
jgi:hypothetical protein